MSKRKNSLPRPWEGGVAPPAPQGERAAGGTSTTGASSQNFSLKATEEQLKAQGFMPMTATETASSAKHFECLHAPQPQAQNSPKPNGNGDKTLQKKTHTGDSISGPMPRAIGAFLPDKTLGQHAQAAERLYASDPHSGISFESVTADPRPNWTPNRVRPKALVAPTVPSVALATPEQQDAFAQSVVDHAGIRPACETHGMKPASVFYWAGSRPDFRKRLDAAQAAVFEEQVYKLNELCDDLLKMPPREMNQCANAYGRVFDYRMRIVGKLLPVLYGDRPGTQVNIQNNTGIVCNEATRERLIALNQQLLNVQSKTKELEQ